LGRAIDAADKGSTAMSFDLRFPAHDLAAGAIVIPLWAAAILVFVAMTLLFVAIARAGARDVIGSIVRIGLIVLGAAAVLVSAQWLRERDRADERRALDQRIMDLTMRATAAGSPLGCLNLSPGDGVDTGCEKAMFAGPDTVAAASAYVDASLALLAQAHASGMDANTDAVLGDLRRTMESDRFGFVAQGLARKGCTPPRCDRFVLFSDATQIRANLQQRTFETLVARYAGSWQQPAQPQQAQVLPRSLPAAGTRVGGGINYPSAASIPAVSIMTAEQPGPMSQSAPPPKPPAAAPRMPLRLETAPPQ
jgi:hypothetical protein